MPRQTANLGLRTPLATDAPDGPGGMAVLADDIDVLLAARLPRTLLIATRNGGGSPAIGAWSDVAYDTVSLDPLGVLQSNSVDIRLPFDGVYDIELKIAFNQAPGSGGRFMQKWYAPSGGDGPWAGITNQAAGVPAVYRDTFAGATGINVRASFFLDGTGTAALFTNAPQRPKVVLRYLGKNA